MTEQSATADAEAAAGASRWTVAIFALIGLGFGLVAFAFKTPVYEADTLIAVSNPVGTLEDEIDVVVGASVINAAAASLGFEPEISVTAAEVAGLLTISAKNEDPDRAAAAANTVADTYIASQLGAAAAVSRVAEPPSDPSGIGPLIYAAIGSLLGALFGLLFGYAQQTQVDRLRKQAREEQPESDPAPASTSLVPAEARVAAAPPQAAPTPVPTRVPAPDPTPVVAAPVATPESSRPMTQPSPPSTTASAFASASGMEPPAVEGPAPATIVTSWFGGNDDTPEITPAEETQATETQAAQTPATQTPATETQATQTQATTRAEATEAQATETQATEAAASTEPRATAEATETAAVTETIETVDAPDDAGEQNLKEHDRRALQSQFESARYELVLAHDEEIAHLNAEHERQATDLRAEIANLNKQVRVQAVRYKSRTGNDQTRVGDLEAQVDALEAELTGLRDLLESERIDATKRLTDERGTADRALDNARRQYREELAKHVHTHRQTMAEHRVELDRELAADRAKHAEALEEAHRDYERQLEAERERAESKLAGARERQELETDQFKEATLQEVERQALQHKETIEALRTTSESSDAERREAENLIRQLRVEVGTLQSQARHNDGEHNVVVQRLSDELAVLRTELDDERERNAALRADVLRRSAEAHQQIDRAVEERTAQLSELEASISRQREYADTRVREISASAEEQARQAATREANLSATVSRLKRELEAVSGPKPVEM